MFLEDIYKCYWKYIGGNCISGGLHVLTMDRKNRKQKLIVNLFQVHSEKSDLIWFRICMHEKMGPVKI